MCSRIVDLKKMYKTVQERICLFPKKNGPFLTLKKLYIVPLYVISIFSSFQLNIFAVGLLFFFNNYSTCFVGLYMGIFTM